MTAAGAQQADRVINDLEQWLEGLRLFWERRMAIIERHISL